MPADWQSQIGGIPGEDTLHKEKRPVKPGVSLCSEGRSVQGHAG
jgi:hypothetical protein